LRTTSLHYLIGYANGSLLASESTTDAELQNSLPEYYNVIQMPVALDTVEVCMLNYDSRIM